MGRREKRGEEGYRKESHKGERWGFEMAIRPLKRISDHEKEKIIKMIEELLTKHEEIIFAILYGSFVEPEIPERYGDIDLALYVRPDHLNMPTYVFESNIEAEACCLLSSYSLNIVPVEVVTLNHAPYSFINKLFKEKYLILKENEEALTDLIEEVGRRAMDNDHLRVESLRELIGE